MAGSIQQIQQDLTTLDTAITALAQEFEQTYQNYLTALGEAVRKQLILACYHLCTHGYPEAFLKLPFSERQKFQQNLQELAKKAQVSLLALASPEMQLPDLQPHSADPQEPPALEENTDSGYPLGLAIQLQPISSEVRPEQLIHWQEQIESAITQCLSQLSRDTNFQVKECNIFSPQLPEAILEAASQAETTAETVASPPNLLHAMIETEDTENPQSTSVTRLMAIHLRLSEIEFADATVMAGRHQIRSLLGQLNQLKHDYQKKLRDKAVIEAESAWRSSWFELQ